MPNFDNTWARQETQSVTGKLRDAVKPQGALKPRIQTAEINYKSKFRKWILC